MTTASETQYKALLSGGEASLPDAELTLTVDLATGPEVLAARLVIPERIKRGGPLVSWELDGGAVVVDTSEQTGEIVGIEVLRYVAGPAYLPEWRAAVARSSEGNRPLLLLGVAQLMFSWACMHMAITQTVNDVAGMLSQRRRKKQWSVNPENIASAIRSPRPSLCWA